jgi:hypothetical protein
VLAPCRRLIGGVPAAAFGSRARIALERGRQTRPDEPRAGQGTFSEPPPNFVYRLHYTPAPPVGPFEQRQLVGRTQVRGRHADEPDP